MSWSIEIEKLIKWEWIENIITWILYRIHVKWPIYQDDFEKLAYIKKFHNDFFNIYEHKILYLLWLFYKTSKPKNVLEEVYSGISDIINPLAWVRFTPIQASAYKNIKEKKYFSFSAPTSAWKSFLFRELILHTKWDIVIVVPSRALISEYILTVLKIVDNQKDILVLPFIDNVNTSKVSRRIFIITPERWNDLFKDINNFNIDLFLFDEAQISEEPIRWMTFDSFVRRVDRVLPNSKKVFTHPFIENPWAQLLKHWFNQESYSRTYNYNSVWKIYLSVVDNKFKYFSPFYDTKKVKTNENIIFDILNKNWTILIYTSKSKIYDWDHLIDFSEYTNNCTKITKSWALEIIEKLRKFIWATVAEWERHSFMLNMMEKWIVIHHGSLPLIARLLIEEFVNKWFAKICFATSTLLQGINMPFDLVWIDNFSFRWSDDEKMLNLKNLIWRAWRTTAQKSKFDYWFVVINKRNVDTFSSRIKANVSISDKSSLDNDINNINDDLKDIAEAIRNDTFNNDLKLTNSQITRLENSDIDKSILFILDNFLINNKPISGKDYYKFTQRTKLKESFKKIFISHLRRDKLTIAEQTILSTSIPILLWQIQWKSFKEILWLRYAYLTEKDTQLDIKKRLKKWIITIKQAAEERKNIKIKRTAIAWFLPDSKAKIPPLFKRNTSVLDLDYDILVYDTYDYIDKVIGLSLKDPLSWAFQLYYEKTNDKRAITVKNYIKFWTNDDTEIWLLRYGFSFEEIEWLKPYISKIDQTEIKFKFSIWKLSSDQKKVIERFR